MNKLIDHNGPRYHFSTDIPEHYNSTLLRILPCTPKLLYVYWELPEDFKTLNMALQLCISNKKSADELLILDVIMIRQHENSRYIEIPVYGEPFTINLCKVDESGTFSTLCSAMQNVPKSNAPVYSTPGMPVPPYDQSPENNPADKTLSIQESFILNHSSLPPSSWHPHNSSRS